MKSAKIIALCALLLASGLFVTNHPLAATQEDAASMSDEQLEGDVQPSYEDDRSMPAYDDGAAMDQAGEEVLLEEPETAEEAPAR